MKICGFNLKQFHQDGVIREEHVGSSTIDDTSTYFTLANEIFLTEIDSVMIMIVIFLSIQENIKEASSYNIIFNRNDNCYFEEPKYYLASKITENRLMNEGKYESVIKNVKDDPENCQF